MIRAALLSCVAASALAVSAHAAILVKVPKVPRSTVTTLFGLNDAFQIVGSYVGKDDGIEHAFFGYLSGDYCPFDAGPGGTEARAINNKQDIVGFTNSQSGITSDQPIFEMYANSHIHVLDNVFGRAQGIDNLKGRFAGTRWDFSNHEAVAFVGEHAHYRHDVRIPAVHQASETNGINSRGVVVGDYFQPPVQGFIGGGNKLQTVNYPSDQATGTAMEGINDNGKAVGQWFDSAGNTHSFLLDISSGTFTDITVPGATNVYAWNINTQGAVAVSSDAGSYIWCKHAKQCPGGGLAVAAPEHKGKR